MLVESQAKEEQQDETLSLCSQMATLIIIKIFLINN